MRALVSMLSVLSVTAIMAQQTVKIGAYYFPPYVTNTTEASGVYGMVADMVLTMNEV